MEGTQKVEFEKTIHVLDLQDEGFLERYYSVNHFVNLRTIYKDNRCDAQCSKIEIIESIFEKGFNDKRRFIVYMKLSNSILKVFSLTIDLENRGKNLLLSN